MAPPLRAPLRLAALATGLLCLLGAMVPALADEARDPASIGEPAVAPPIPTAAQDPFQDHLSRGIELNRQGQYKEAIKEFQAARALRPDSGLYLYLGLAHRKLGHAKVAIGYYELYLRFEPEPDPALRAELEKYIAGERARMAEEEKARVEMEKQLRPVGAGPGAGAAVPASAPHALELRVQRPAGPVSMPIYRRWWFWGAMGLVAAGTIAGIAVGAAARDPGGGGDVPFFDPAWR